jgi:hypothetical protein
MRARLLFAALCAMLAVMAMPAARAEDQNAKWLGTWDLSERDTGDRIKLVLQEAGGKITGLVGRGSHDDKIVFSMFFSGGLRIRFEGPFDHGDAKLRLEQGGAALSADGVFFSHSTERRVHWTGVRHQQVDEPD